MDRALSNASSHWRKVKRSLVPWVLFILGSVLSLATTMAFARFTFFNISNSFPLQLTIAGAGGFLTALAQWRTMSRRLPAAHWFIATAPITLVLGFLLGQFLAVVGHGSYELLPLTALMVYLFIHGILIAAWVIP